MSCPWSRHSTCEQVGNMVHSVAEDLQKMCVFCSWICGGEGGRAKSQTGNSPAEPVDHLAPYEQQ
eukprot:scaffold40618_cov255-Skeletonema_dohrnii-CCMP3373.AAC.1